MFSILGLSALSTFVAGQGPETVVVVVEPPGVVVVVEPPGMLVVVEPTEMVVVELPGDIDVVVVSPPGVVVVVAPPMVVVVLAGVVDVAAESSLSSKLIIMEISLASAKSLNKNYYRPVLTHHLRSRNPTGFDDANRTAFVIT